jgi:hypothetical protein
VKREAAVRGSLSETSLISLIDRQRFDKHIKLIVVNFLYYLRHLASLSNFWIDKIQIET